MKPIPRILPLVGVAAGGVLALNALAGAQGLPNLVSGARAFAEEAAKGPQPKGAKAKAGEGAAVGEAKDVASVAMPALPAVKPPAPVCAPTAAELAKEAGLSPAELQVLQSLGARRGQLDKREEDLDVQLALMAAAEAKLDAKLKSLNGLKGDIQNLLGQADAKQAAEVDRMVKVFEGMKAKDAAPRMAVLDDAVRLPIAAKMKERALSGILAAMSAADAKQLTEALAKRYSKAQTLAAVEPPAAPAAPPAAAKPAAGTAAPAAKPPAKRAAAPRKPAPKAPAVKQAAAAAPAAVPAAAAGPSSAPPAPAAPPAG